MVRKSEHLLDEADIGSGEKTPAEREDLEQTKHLGEQQKQASQQGRPQDGSQLHQVVEEQQFINQQESHTPHNLVETGQEHADDDDTKERPAPAGQPLPSSAQIPERQPPNHC